MNKYINLKIAIDSESVNIFVDTGDSEDGIHVAYWHLDEWLEDAESSVPATIKAVQLYYTNPDELIDKILNPNLPDPRNFLFTSEDVEKFVQDWGQTHRGICSELGYELDGSDELLMDDYFWHPTYENWFNKSASMFSEKEQIIADFLRNQTQE